MNILFFTDVPFPHGTAGSSRIRNLAKSLIREDNQIFVLSAYEKIINPIFDKNFEGIFYSNNESKRYSKSNFIFNLFYNFFKIKKILPEICVKYKIDVFIIFSWSSLLFYQVINFGKKEEIKVFADIVEFPSDHSFRFGKLNPFYWNSVKYFHQDVIKVDGIIAISSEIKQFYTQLGKNVVIIPALVDENFIPPKVYSYDPWKNLDNIKVSYFGSLSKKDDPNFLIEVIQKLSSKPIQFSIIGSDGNRGNAKKLKKIIEKDERINKKVIFEGHLSYDNLMESFKTTCIFVFPRKKDIDVNFVFPNRIPEILLTKRPLITHDIGDLKHYLANNYDVVLCDVANQEEMVEKILYLINNSTNAKKIGENARISCLEKFTPNNYSKLLREFIEGCK